MLNESKSPLAAISVLKKICCHPLLLGEASLRHLRKLAEQGTGETTSSQHHHHEESAAAEEYSMMDAEADAADHAAAQAVVEAANLADPARFRDSDEPIDDELGTAELVRASGKLVLLIQLLPILKRESVLGVLTCVPRLCFVHNDAGALLAMLRRTPSLPCVQPVTAHAGCKCSHVCVCMLTPRTRIWVC